MISLYIPGTQVRIRRPCPDCVDGKVELSGTDQDFVPIGCTLRLYHRGYCPTCGGLKWIEDWTSVETLSRWMKDLI